MVLKCLTKARQYCCGRRSRSLWTVKFGLSLGLISLCFTAYDFMGIEGYPPNATPSPGLKKALIRPNEGTVVGLIIPKISRVGIRKLTLATLWCLVSYKAIPRHHMWLPWNRHSIEEHGRQTFVKMSGKCRLLSIISRFCHVPEKMYLAFQFQLTGLDHYHLESI